MWPWCWPRWASCTCGTTCTQVCCTSCWTTRRTSLCRCFLPRVWSSSGTTTCRVVPLPLSLVSLRVSVPACVCSCVCLFLLSFCMCVDIVSKSYMEVCGDLNTVACILSVIHLFGWGLYNSPVGRCVLGCKLLMAYFGQYCHRMSHALRKDRPAAVQFLQDKGLMLSASAHGMHHKTYDDMFCIGSGVCNPFLAWCRRNVTSNPSIWLVVFLVASIVDCVLLTRLIESLLL
ncbi:MAG: hypothetical protein MHM6MM_002885 [Cercozoa sp. M6MM]